MRMMLELFTDPDSFFHKDDEPEFFGPVCVVFLAGLVSAGSPLVIFQQLLASPEVDAFVSVGLLLGIFGGVLTIFLLWFVFAGTFHMLSTRFGGSGDFKTLFLFVGWGFVPLVFSGLVSIIATYLATQTVPSPTNLDAIDTFTNQIQSSPFVKISTILSAVFTLWSGLIWTFSIKNSRSINFRPSLITAGIPVSAMVIWTIYGLL